MSVAPCLQMNEEAFEKKHISSEKELLSFEKESIVKNEKKVSKARILTWITASVAVAASLFLFIFRSSQEISQPTEFSMELFSEVTSPKQVEQTLSDGYCVVSTPAATTTLVTLSDGTRVMLNANSKLEYPVSFSDTEVRGSHCAASGRAWRQGLGRGQVRRGNRH